MKRVITFALFFTVLFTTLFSAPAFAIEDISPVASRDSFEKQNVRDDLEAVYGKGLDTEAFTDVKDLDIIHTMEYGYKSGDLSDYGFYIYVYDPLCRTIDSAVLFAAIGEGTSLSYYPMICEILSRYDGFYKCKVITDGLFTTASKRTYNIASIQVNFYNHGLKQFKHGRTYRYTGNMKGYGSPIDTLSCTYSSLEVIDLETKFTYYRTAGSEKGLGWQNQINTVYFSVPNSYLEKYGHISKIHHKYTEYETGPMIVTDSTDVYYYFENLYKEDKKATFDEGHYGLFDKISVGTALSPKYESGFYFNYDYDGDTYKYTDNSPFRGNYRRPVFWFYDAKLLSRGAAGTSISTAKIFEFIEDHPDMYFGTYDDKMSDDEETLSFAYSVYPFEKDSDCLMCLLPFHLHGYCPKDSSEENYIRFVLLVDDIKDKKDYYEFLFENKLDEYNDTLDLEDAENIDVLLSYDSTHSFWQKVDDFGFWSTVFQKAYIVDDKTVTVYPFSVIDDHDLDMSAESFSDKYLVSEKDVQDIKNAYNEASEKDSTLFLFRFDVSDYYVTEVDTYTCDPAWIDDYKLVDGVRGLVCMQSYYDDFQIISLTFKKDGVETIVPVTDTPDDFIGDITTPPEKPPLIDMSKKQSYASLIALVLIAVLIFIFRKPLSKLMGVIIEGLINGIKRFIGLFKKK